MASVLIAAPHPDDEAIGCGGTLLKHRVLGDTLHWLIFTEMAGAPGYSAARCAARETEIAEVAKHFGMASVHRLGFPTAGLDQVPLGEMVGRIADIFREVTPETVYVPFPGDAHSDHRIAYECVTACTKWFRAASVRRILAYEALSETDITPRPGGPVFQPTVYEDITAYLDGKIAALAIYGAEMGEAPFPRSAGIVRAKAMVRGAEAGFHAAEGFMLIKEIRP